GRPCNAQGVSLSPDDPAPPPEPRAPNDYTPYTLHAHFELADFLFRKEQMSAANINDLMQIWAATLPPDHDPPFTNSRDLYESIDTIPLGDIPWQEFRVTYTGPRPDNNVLSWMLREYSVWFRCPRRVLHTQLGNRNFAKDMDFAAKQVFHGEQREYKDFMSGDWAWRQSDIIAQDPANVDTTFCPIVLGSDKTTVSVATGQNEYYALYLSNGLVRNTARRAHWNAVSLVAFLAVPKTDREFAHDLCFHKFRRQLFHASLRTILDPLHTGMTVAEIMRCADGHFRRVIYGLGPYIADYPEQVLLACVMQGWCAKCTSNRKDLDESNVPRRCHGHTQALLTALDLKVLWDEYGIAGDLVPFTTVFPRADIHEMLLLDLLHQIIKGTFKDHLVTWVGEYLELKHGKAGAAVVLADIDRRIAAVPSFPGLCRFPEGRGFKQWTGDDSKALMKVYLPVIVGHVPAQMVHALSAFLEFCYLVRREAITTDTLVQIEDALQCFHQDRVIFEDIGVRLPNGLRFSLPRQHSMSHYPYLTQNFGAPNGLCSSITKSKHIQAVKEPYRHSNRYEALGQMLLTNQHLDKLAAARSDFTTRSMLQGAWVHDPAVLIDVDAAVQEDDDGGPVDADVLGKVTLAKRKARGFPKTTNGVAMFIGAPQLPNLIRRFLHVQLNDDVEVGDDAIDIELCPPAPPRISVFPSALAVFYTPSDLSGIKGMKRERIRACMLWRSSPARNDCVFVDDDEALPGFQGLAVVRIRLFFSFKHHDGSDFPCALVSWFVLSKDTPCDQTGMWIVKPHLDAYGLLVMSVIHLDCILRAAHLIGVAGAHTIPRTLTYTDSLDAFNAFYVNKYADHHAHEIAF
ncbi:hypothetical protein C2E23DRAFT_740030, partial [Lenzites betulinus]